MRSLCNGEVGVYIVTTPHESMDSHTASLAVVATACPRVVGAISPRMLTRALWPQELVVQSRGLNLCRAHLDCLVCELSHSHCFDNPGYAL